MTPEAAPRPWPPERPSEVPPDAERCNWWAGRCEWPVHGDEHQHYTEHRGGVWREGEAAAGTALDASLIAEALHVGDFDTPCPFRKRPLEKCPLLVSHTNRGDIIAAEYARLAGVDSE